MALHNKVIDGVTVLVDDDGVVRWRPTQVTTKVASPSSTTTTNNASQVAPGGETNSKQPSPPQGAFDAFLHKEVIDGTGIKVWHTLSFGAVVMLLARGGR